jgi:DNA-binding response OmpR family regulator
LTKQSVNRQLCLVLEDNWLIAEGLSNELMQIGFERVECHSTCADALSYLDQIAPRVPNLALLDLSIGINETCLPVAQELQNLKVPVIIVSGHGPSHELARQLPDVPVLQKPVFEKELTETIDQILGTE